jgi:hypothetical protein
LRIEPRIGVFGLIYVQNFLLRILNKKGLGLRARTGTGTGTGTGGS